MRNPLAEGLTPRLGVADIEIGNGIGIAERAMREQPALPRLEVPFGHGLGIADQALREHRARRTPKR